MLMANIMLLFVCLTIASARILVNPMLKDNQCEIYRCNSAFTMTTGQCVYFEGNSFILQACDEGFYCPAEFGVKTNSTCVQVSTSAYKTAWPGESCNNDGDCAYGTCISHVCFGQQEYSFCSSHDDCNVGMRCNQNRCVAQLDIGDTGCTTDYDCVNNAGCTGSQCVEYFSLKERAFVSCNGTEPQYSNFCASGNCYGTVCLAPLEHTYSQPQECYTDSDCKSLTYESKEGLTYYSSCECAYNKKATSYCSLLSGDDVYLDYLNFLKNWYSSKEVMKCNTARRLAPDCIEDVAGEHTSQKYLYLSLLALNYAQLQDSDHCVRNVYFYNYYEAGDYLDVDDAATVLSLYGASLVLLLSS